MIQATEVTNWPERIALTLLTIAFALGMFSLMRVGWRNKLRVQSEIVAPAEVPADFVARKIYRGRYLPSTAAGAWLTRIAVHDLGVPSRCELQIGDAGLAFVREGARSFYVPFSDIHSTRADRAIAGKAFEKDGIAVMTWRLGDVEIDTGFRADAVSDHIEFLEQKLGEKNA